MKNIEDINKAAIKKILADKKIADFSWMVLIRQRTRYVDSFVDFFVVPKVVE